MTKGYQAGRKTAVAAILLLMLGVASACTTPGNGPAAQTVGSLLGSVALKMLLVPF